MAGLSFGKAFIKLFGLDQGDESFYDDLSDILVENDVGARASAQFVKELQDTLGKTRKPDRKSMMMALKGILSPCLPVFDANAFVRAKIILVLGVNGVGKTTSIAKIAKYRQDSLPGEKIVFAAGDTFRAAAIDQLKHHGERLSIPVLALQSGTDPGAIIHDAVTAISAGQADVAIADTAGRLHNKTNLVRELERLVKIISARIQKEQFLKLLVIDATTGQNGFIQAKTFHEAVGVDGIVLSKYDSTAKGGIAISIGKELGIPVAFLGSGESYGDLSLFDRETFLDAFLGTANA